jgi:hypothetical protein
MLDVDAAKLTEDLKRSNLRLDVVSRRVDALEAAVRKLELASQRQGQAIRSNRPPSRE